MYLTFEENCRGGGEWETYATSKHLEDDLGLAESSGSIYARFKDAAGNKTACISSKIHLTDGQTYHGDTLSEAEDL